MMAPDRTKRSANSGKVLSAAGAEVDVALLVARMLTIVQAGDIDVRVVDHDWAAIHDGDTYMIEEYKEGIVPDGIISLSMETPPAPVAAIHIIGMEIYSSQVYGRFLPWSGPTMNSGLGIEPVNLNQTPTPLTTRCPWVKRNANRSGGLAGPGGICGNRRVVAQYKGILAPSTVYAFELQNKHASNNAVLWMRMAWHEVLA